MKRLLTIFSLLLTAVCAVARHYDLTAQRISTADGLPTNVVVRIWQDEAGYMCFDTRNGLCRYDGYAFQTVERTTVPVPPDTKSLTTRDATWRREGQGRLSRKGSDGTIRTWQLIAPEIIAYTRSDHFHVADVDERTEAISTYGCGLYLYDKPTGELTQLTKENTDGLLDDDYLTGLYVDRTGCIWVIEDYLGVNCLRLNPLQYTTLWLNADAPIQDANYIRCIAPMDSTRLLVSNQMGDVYEYDTAKGSFTFVEHTRHRVYAALRDSKGRRWIGMRGGGLSCDGQMVEGLPSPHIFHIREANDGSVLVSMLGGGVARLHDSGRHDFLLAGKNAHDAQTDHQGRLWVATEEGLFVLNGLQQVTDSISGSFVCLYVDRKGSVWAGTTDRGLLKASYATRRDAGIETAFYQKGHGLMADAVYSIVEDAAGCLWLGTEEGLAQLNPTTHVIMNHHISDRPLGNVFCERAAVGLGDGRLLFGSHLGMVLAMPTQAATATPPATLVTGLMVNGERMATDAQLTYRQNNVTLLFSNFQYARQQDVLYHYYLEGVDKTWNSATTEHAAVYRNLSPGRYTFHVYSSISGTRGQEATLSLLIRQPWWNTWWAWLLYVLLGTALLVAAFVTSRRILRLHRQLDVERRVSAFKRDFYNRVERELRNPINVVQGATENVGLSGTSKTTMQSLRRGSKRMLKLMDMIRQFHQLDEVEMQVRAEQDEMNEEAEQRFRDIQQSIHAEETELKELAPPPINEQTILVAEGDEDNLTHLADTLNPYFRIVSTQLMADVPRLIEEHRPALLLMDISGDERAGRELTKTVSLEHPSLPVVHLSANDDDASQLRSLRMGAADYVVKPFSGKILLERISKIIGRADSDRVPRVAASPQKEILTNVGDKRFLDQFYAVLSARVSDENFSVEQFASVMNLGRTQFYKKVKALTGETPVQHLHRARLDYAYRLLRDTTMTVEEVMLRAGFHSATHFYNSFKKQFGMSPKLVRQTAV